MTNRRQRLGAAGERLVRRWYLRHGYEIVDQNWRCSDGELDLVVRKDSVLVFCEVKTRSTTRFGTPFEAVTAAKQARLRRLGVRWLEAHSIRSRRLRFDVAAVLPGSIEVREAAF